MRSVDARIAALAADEAAERINGQSKEWPRETLCAKAFPWREPVTIPRRQFLYDRHHVRRYEVVPPIWTVWRLGQGGFGYRSRRQFRPLACRVDLVWSAAAESRVRTN